MCSATPRSPARCRNRLSAPMRRPRSAPLPIAALLARRDAGRAGADQHLLQPGRARLRHLDRRRLSSADGGSPTSRASGGVSPPTRRARSARSKPHSPMAGSRRSRTKCSVECAADSGPVCWRSSRRRASRSAALVAYQVSRRRDPAVADRRRRAMPRAAARSCANRQAGLCLLCHPGRSRRSASRATSGRT